MTASTSLDPGVRQLTRRRLLRGTALAASLTACGAPARQRSGTTVAKDPLPLTVWVGPTDTLHPRSTSPQIAAALFSPLVVTTADSRLPAWGPEVPGALLDRLSTTDLRRWTLDIKPDWRWHDGGVVEAGDVARGWNQAIAAGSPITSTVADVRVRSKTSLSFSLTGPFGQMPTLLGDPAFLPLPPLAEVDAARFAEAPVGNGPYRLTGRRGQTLLLAAVEDHPAGPPRSAELAIARDPEPQVSHQVAVGPDGLIVFPAAGQVQRQPGRQLAYLGFPLYDPRFADPAVRRALSLAIDRASLVQQVLGGGGLPAQRLIGPGFARADTVTCPDCSYDPDRAVELWPRDFEGPLTLWFAADSGHEPVMEFVAGAWREVLGVQDIQLASLPQEDLLRRLQEGEVSGPFRLTWAADVPSASRVIQPLFGPRGSANDFRYRDPAIRDHLDKADLQRDLLTAVQAYGMAEQAVVDDLPLIPLWFSTVPVAAAAGVDAMLDGHGRLVWSGVGTA